MVSMKLLSVRLLALVLAGAGCLALPVAAQSVPHLSTTQPGGMPGLPVMGGVSKVPGGVQITWDGPSGYYQVFQKANNLSGSWVAWGQATNLSRTATIPAVYGKAFFRVSGPAPKYAGSKICISCHLSVCRYETNTAHASAFKDPLFKAAGGQNNPACLVCHTVGYGLKVNGAAVGFVSASATPQFEGVQCENCHGPAANHAAAEDDPSVRPQVEVAATVCGGCHFATPTQHPNDLPTFEEWSAGGHAAVVPAVLSDMSRNSGDIRSCGVCHSGSARLALINGKDPATTLANDYNVPQTCAVCHDPHATNNAAPVQLRNPLFSTKDFHLPGSAVASVGAFTNQYNASANINLCAQCHNDRGAAWTDTTNAPHHSLQYNMLLGTVGVLASGTQPFSGAHAGWPDALSGGLYATNQCATCHMSSDASGGHDHSLAVNYNACALCHNGDGPSAQAGWSAVLSNQVAVVISDLNRWAASQTNALLATNGVVAWEYSRPGGLTWQTNAAGAVLSWSLANPVSFRGPVAAGQARIAANILKARFNLYLYLNDGSFGVHNPIYAYQLLDFADSCVRQELAN